MTNIQQRCLYLTSKLCDIAAEFTDAELKELAQKSKDNAAVYAAIQSLIGLHAAYDANSNVIRDDENTFRKSTGATSTRSSLSNIFADNQRFPTVAKVAEALKIEPQPKESRERYMSRVAKYIDGLSSEEKESFFHQLIERLKRDPGNFVAQWSKLIGSL